MASARVLLASGTFWSGVLCMASINRGTAYLERPPESSTVSSGAIETFMPYWGWGVILLVTAAAIILGHLNKSLRPCAIVAHVISAWAYGTFAFSTIGAAIVTGQSWVGFGTLFTQALLHGARAVFIGDAIAEDRGANADR